MIFDCIIHLYCTNLIEAVKNHLPFPTDIKRISAEGQPDRHLCNTSIVPGIVRY